MTALDHCTIAMPAHVRPALGLRVVNAVAGFLRALRNRREIYRLGEMSDAELADIGLVRGDLHVAWSLPIGSDPTTKLGALSETRIQAAATGAQRAL